MCAPTEAPAADDRRLDDGAGPDACPRADHGEAADPRAGADDRAVAHVHRRHESRRRIDVGTGGDEGVVGAERVAELRAEVPLEHVSVGLQVRLGRADVEPVARQGDPVDGLLLDELREDLALDRDGAVGRDQLEHVRLEHVQARVDQVGVDLLGRGFSRKLSTRPAPLTRTSP